MRFPPSLPARRPPPPWLGHVAPALAVSAVLLIVGMGWATHPVGLLILGPAVLLAFGFVLQTVPIILYWMVPASMILDFKRPVQAYDVLIVLLALATLLATRSKSGGTNLRLQPVEWRFLLLIAFMFTALFGPVQPRRFLAAVKLYSVSLLAFETARWAVPRLGRTALAWGPAFFCGITALQLFDRLRVSGIPSFKSVTLRTYITDLSWGTSNYVAAALVVCLPSVVFLLRNLPMRSGRYWLALGILTGTLGSLLLTSSRGGFVLAVGYFIVQGTRLRRANWIAIGGAAAAAVALAMSPFGTGLLGRFTSPQGMDSVLHRVAIWKNAFARGTAHLPFGTGAGQGFFAQDKLGELDPHCFPLSLFSETGPVGLLLWIWIIAALWRAAARLGAAPSTQLAGQTLAATISIMLVNSLFEPTMPGYLYQTLFWWMAGSLHGVGPPADLPVAGATEAAPSGEVPARA